MCGAGICGGLDDNGLPGEVLSSFSGGAEKDGYGDPERLAERTFPR